MRPYDRELLAWRPRLLSRHELLTLIEPVPGTKPAPAALSEELRLVLDNPAADIRDLADTAVEELKSLVADLAICLGQEGQEYQGARSAGDVTAASAFEDHHATDTAGKIQAEVLPLILDAVDDVAQQRTRLSGYLPVGPIDAAREAEARQTLAAVSQGNVPTSLITRAHLLRAHRQRIEAHRQFARDVAAACRAKPADLLGSPDRLIRAMTENPKALPAIEKLALVQFRARAFESQQGRLRQRMTGGPELWHKAEAQAHDLADLVDDVALPATAWLAGIGTGTVPGLTELILEAAGETLDERDRALKDVYKAQAMEDLDRQDLLNVFVEKKSARQTVQVCQDLNTHFNFDNPDREREVRRFIQERGLDGPGTICS